MRTVIFDLDGTLADTAGDLIAAANAALVRLGHPPQLTMGADDATAFAGGRAMLRLAASRLALTEPEALADAGYPLLLDAYGADFSTYAALYPGAVRAVDRLRAAGHATGICTNKPEALAVALLAHLGITDRFAALIGADSLPTRKPDPAPLLEAIARLNGDPTRSVLIGDTVTDRKTAAAAGVPCVLVTFGPTGRAVLDLAPEAVLDDFDDLDRVLEGLLP